MMEVWCDELKRLDKILVPLERTMHSFLVMASSLRRSGLRKQYPSWHEFRFLFSSVIGICGFSNLQDPRN